MRFILSFLAIFQHFLLIFVLSSHLNSDEDDGTHHGRYQYGFWPTTTATVLSTSTTTTSTSTTSTTTQTTSVPVQQDTIDKSHPQKSIVELNANLTFASVAERISSVKKLKSGDTVVLHKYEDLKYVQQRKGIVSKMLQQTHIKRANHTQHQHQNLSFDDIEHTKNQNLFFSGDLFLTPNQLDTVVIDFVRQKHNNKQQSHKRNKRQISQTFVKKWPLTIPYMFDEESDADTKTKESVLEALQFWQSHTCVNFALAPNVTAYRDFLVFDKTGGCSSFKGRIGGPQPLHIGTNCERFGVVSHEIGHSLGLWHHHQRYDREQFISVLWDQIRDDRVDNFYKCGSLEQCDSHNVPYDYGSVMHYPAKAFSIAEHFTLVPRPQLGYVSTIGSREFGPSFYDVMEVNRNYCPNVCGSVVLCSNGGYAHPKNCSKCLCPYPFSGDMCDSVISGSPDECGGIIQLSAGKTIQISSPNHPQLFQSGQSCSWLFETEEDSRIQMEFTGDQFSFIQADADPLCYATFVEIRNSTDLSNTGVRYCGYEKPAGIITSMTNRLIILLRSVPEAFDFGFKANVWSIRASDLCFNSISNWVIKLTADPFQPKLPQFNVTKIEGVTHPECQNVCRNNQFCASYSYLTKDVSFAQCLLISTTCAKQPRICQWNANAFYSENDCHIEPVNCELSDWSQWSNCSDKCGLGIQSRSRTVTKLSQGGGLSCYNFNTTEIRDCNDRICSSTKVIQDPCNALPCDFDKDLCGWKSNTWQLGESHPPKNSVTGVSHDADNNQKGYFAATDSPSVSVMSTKYMLMPDAPAKVFKFKYWLASYGVELKLCVNFTNCNCSTGNNCLWSEKFDNKTLPETPNGLVRSWRPCKKQSNFTWDCRRFKVSVTLPKFTNKLYFVATGLTEQSYVGLDSFSVTGKNETQKCSPMTENDVNFAINSCLPESNVAATIILGDIYRSYRGSSDPDWDGSLEGCKKLCVLETECKAMEFYDHGDEPECLLFETTCADDHQQCLTGIVSAKYYENLCYKSKI